MGIKSFLQDKLSHFGRNALKRDTIRQVLDAPEQYNTGVVNVHRYDPTNIGDFYCAPHHYFEQLRGTQLDIFDYKREEPTVRQNWSRQIIDNSLIIGGGGLLNREGFYMQMDLFQQLGTMGKKTVIWGAGHNSKYRKDFGRIQKYSVDLTRFGLAGTRDYGMSDQWVPCVSCMHPIFDEKHDIENEIGIIFHKKTLRDKAILDKFASFPSTSNDSDFAEVAKFIGKTDTILTDSYHAMYWSLMLGKKVMVFPNSSKFYNFKYMPVISSFDRFEQDLKKMHSYSGVMEECREINTKFAHQVFDYLNI